MVIPFGVILPFNTASIGHLASHTVLYCVRPHTHGELIAHLLRSLVIARNALKESENMNHLPHFLTIPLEVSLTSKPLYTAAT